MKTFKNIFKSVYLPIKILFILSLIFILFYKFLFLKCSEIFSGAAIGGEISYNLSLAILASTIFYFVVIHLKDFYDKKDVFKIVNHRLTGLTNIKNRIQSELREDFNNNNISEGLFKDVLSRISPNDKSSVAIYPSKGEHTWMDFLILFVNKISDIIKDIYQFMPYLDRTLLNILYKIETSIFIADLKSFTTAVSYEDTNLSSFAKSFYDYTKIIDELDSYAKEKIKLYM